MAVAAAAAGKRRVISDEANRRVATAHYGWSATFYRHWKNNIRECVLRILGETSILLVFMCFWEKTKVFERLLKKKKNLYPLRHMDPAPRKEPVLHLHPGQ